MIIDPEKYAHEYELDAKSMIDCGEESVPVSIVSMRLWLRAAHAVVELTGPSDSDGKTFGSDGNVSLWLHESDLALGNILLDRISSENAKLRELATDALKHIIEVECEAPNRERFRGKPCEDCVEYGSSDCPKIMARMYGELGVEVS